MPQSIEEKTKFWLDKLPEEFRSGVDYMAYERGHGYGQEEILVCLVGLVGDLLPMIEKFEKRIKNI